MKEALIVIALVFACLAMMYVGTAEGQTDSWAVCKNLQNGSIQSFQGGCPPGWVFVSW